MKEAMQICVRTNPYYQVLDKLAQDNKDISFDYHVSIDKGAAIDHVLVILKFKRTGGIQIQANREFPLLKNSVRQAWVVEINLLWEDFILLLAEQAVTNDLVGRNRLV
jgi:hypothetical protein